MTRGHRLAAALLVLALSSCGKARLTAKAAPTAQFPRTWDEPAVVVAKAPEIGYDGPRSKIKAPGSKCAAMPLQTSGVTYDIARLMDEVLLTELNQAGFDSIGTDDINEMLGLERAKDAMGCSDAACIAEIGGALGVDYLISGRLASVDGVPIVTLKLMDVKHARVLARTNQMGTSSSREMPKLLAVGVQDLVHHLDAPTP